tara:strand:+ start:972 stop:1349 length:378 start_codon:yes stop_codon:yes gene_type:complete
MSIKDVTPFATRIITKPWGSELIWAETKDYVGKLITISHNNRLSRQYHVEKEETVYVIYGTMLLEIGEGENIKKHELRKGESYHISPGVVHRFCAPYGDVEIMEVSTPHLSDVVRLEDDYKRELK